MYSIQDRRVVVKQWSPDPNFDAHLKILQYLSHEYLRTTPYPFGALGSDPVMDD